MTFTRGRFVKRDKITPDRHFMSRKARHTHFFEY